MAAIHRAIMPLLMLALVACAWLAPLDGPATDQVDAGLRRALISFVTARALNAAISVAQGTEISVQPVGVGATFAPGQLLDPANQGLIDKLRGWFSHNTDVKARFDDLKRALEKATEHLIRLMVVFVLQTAVMPALLLWILWAWARSLFEPGRS